MWTGDRSCPRCGQPRGPLAAPPPPQPTVAEPAWSAPVQRPLDARGAGTAPGAAATQPARRDVHSPPPEDRRRKNGVLVAVAALLVVAVVVAGVVLFRDGMLGGRAAEASTPEAPATIREPSADATAPEKPSDSGVEKLPTTGEPLTAGATVTAPPASADATDGNGDTTSYEASNMLDGDPETTWRMDGDGSGETITFTFDDEQTISRLGLVNGYAKTDPASGADRYAQTRRITAVTWTIGADRFDQRLEDRDRTLQTLAIRPVKGDEVTLEIDRVTQPGNPTFDQTAISEVEILG